MDVARGRALLRAKQTELKYAFYESSYCKGTIVMGK